MGTRNITFVIKNEEKAVAQYCQWDGYPTGRGEEVLMFVKNLISTNQIGEFERRIGLSSLSIAADNHRTYTGAPYDTAKEALFERVEKHQRRLTQSDGNYHPFESVVGNLFESGKLTKEEADYLVIASRDTGNRALEYLMKYCPEGLVFWTDEYIKEMDVDCDWQIDGVFVIDLDKRLVTISFRGNTRTFSFSDLENMSDEHINDVMTAMESE